MEGPHIGGKPNITNKFCPYILTPSCVADIALLACLFVYSAFRRHLDDIKKYVPEFVSEFIPEFIPEFVPEFDLNTDFYLEQTLE